MHNNDFKVRDKVTEEQLTSNGYNHVTGNGIVQMFQKKEKGETERVSWNSNTGEIEKKYRKARIVF